MFHPQLCSRVLLAAPLMFAPALTLAAVKDDAFNHQQAQQQALEKQLTPPVPDVRLSPPAARRGALIFPLENPCFTLRQVSLEGQQAFPGWLHLSHLAQQAQGRCMGAQSINLLMGRLQNRLIDHGFVTARVLAPQQNLHSGTLRLRILPGRIGQVRLTADSQPRVVLYSAFPAHAGQLLDLRDIEQGLENLQRLPTVKAGMEIVPGAQPGESDILLHRQQSKIWRVAASLDDSGTKSTGRYQGGLTLFLDNPLALSDAFYLSASHDLSPGRKKGTHNETGHYSLPFGAWQAGITVNNYRYHQTVAGLNGDAHYSGSSQSVDAQLSRVLQRDGNGKTTATFDVIAREQRYYFERGEVAVQRRRTTNWRVGLAHHHYFSAATLEAGISYQHGTRWFGAKPAPEETFDEATAIDKIIQYRAALDVPFSLGTQSFRYNLQYLRQTSSTPLTPQDRFSLGNRWSVRGFDGERDLSGSHGWYVRNDLAWRTPLPEQELYLGADYGEVGGAWADLIGQHLAGGVMGLRGNAFHVGYDLFAGVPLAKPDGYRTSPVTLGFTLNWSW